MSGFFSGRRLPRADDTIGSTPPILIEGRNLGPRHAGQSATPFARRLPYDAKGLPGFPAQDTGEISSHSAPSINVGVNNNGQFYRPWREELGLSFAKTIGNFFAWPFRLVGRLAEGILNAGVGIVKMMLIAVVAPTLIYTGLAMYEARAKGESSTEVAAEVGKQGIGLVGAVLGGIWDGIFGDDEAPGAKKDVQPAE